MPAWFTEQMFEPVDVAYDAVPLAEVMADLTEKYSLPLALDPRAPEIQEMEGDLPITLHVSGLPLNEALALMLAQHELGWVVEDDQLLVTLEELVYYYRWVIRMYLVSDLLQHVGQDETLVVPKHQPDVDELIDLIQNTIAPTTWDEVGGVGSIVFEENSQVLLISQTWPVHLQIELLLDKLREARDISAAQFPHQEEPLDDDGLIVQVYRVTRPVSRQPPNMLAESAEPAEEPEPAPDPEAYIDELAATLVEFIEPESWETAGGSGAIRSVGGWIFVRQTPAVHAQLREVLQMPAFQPNYGSFPGAPFGGGAGF